MELGIQYLTLLVLSAAFIIVVFSNLYAMYMLRCNRESENGGGGISRVNQRATITVLILSVLFCVLNITFMVVLGCNVSHQCSLPDNSLLGWFSFWIAIPLNSCLNPCVYFIRKQEMRSYLRRRLSEWQGPPALISASTGFHPDSELNICTTTVRCSESL